MARWAVTASKGAGNVQGVLYLNAAAATPRRAKVYDFTLGCGAAPADNTFIHILQRCTTTPTAASRSPNSLDPADVAATTIQAFDTVTVDGSLTASAFLGRKALNQRATYRWVASTYGELIIPATANNGIMLGLSAASTTSFDYDASYEEY